MGGPERAAPNGPAPVRAVDRPVLADFVFRRLEKPEEFRSAAELARSAGVGLGEDPVAPSLLRTVQDNGGIVLGAFADVHLAAVAAAYLGWDGTTLYLYAYLMTVRPEYRTHGLGRRLALHLRELAVGLGLTEIRWTYDPLQSAPALLGVRRLGAVPDRYLPHYFGRTGSAGNPDIASDRLRVVWRLSDPAVEALLRDGPKPRTAEEEVWQESGAIVETEVGEQGLRVPTAVAEPSRPKVHLEVPFDIEGVREHEPASARIWRNAVRDGFRAAFDLGYVVEGFSQLPIEHERRSFYWLRAPSPGPPGR